MILAVIDTNILVSALLSPSGNEALLVNAIRDGAVKPCLTDSIVREYEQVLRRPKFRFREARVLALLAIFYEKGEVFQAESTSAVSPDPSDTKFLQCALAASANLLITGNQRHFPNSPYGSTYVISTRELLAYLDPSAPIRS